MSTAMDRIAKVQADTVRLEKRAADMRKTEIADLRAELEGLEKRKDLTGQEWGRKADVEAKLSQLENLDLMREAMANPFRV